MKAKAKTSAQQSGKKGNAEFIGLRLYVAGQTPRSFQSIENLRLLCEKHLKGRFDLEVIDIYQQPALAAEGQIIATPTLIKTMPLPLRRLVGDFSDHSRVVLGLELKPS